MTTDDTHQDIEYEADNLYGLTRAESPTPADGLCVITGYGLENAASQLKIVMLQNEIVSFPQASTDFLLEQGTTVEVAQQYENVMTVSIPNGRFSVYAFYLEGKNKFSDSLIINKARLDWLSKDRIEPGMSIRAFGRALVSLDLYSLRDDDDNPVSYSNYVKSYTKVAVKDSTGIFHWAQALKTSAYEVEFLLPQHLPFGNCEVYIHNGQGGNLGWSEPLILEICIAEKWPNKVFSVKDFGAIGDGFSDDGEAIQQTLEAIRENGGGIAYFPAGGYHFAKTLRVPKKTVLKGESKERSWLFMPDGYNTNARDASALLGIAGEGGIGLEELSIHAVYPNVVIAAPVGSEIPQSWTDITRIEQPEPGFENADNSFVRKCRILHNFSHLYHRRYNDETFKNIPYLREEMKTHWNSSAFVIRGKHVEITESEIQGKGTCVTLCDCDYSKVSDNIFHAGEAGCSISVQSSKDGYGQLIIENNTMDSIAPSHHGVLWMMYGGNNIFVANNQLVRQFWVSDCEGLLGHMWGYRIPMYITSAQKKQATLDVDRIEQYWSKYGKPEWPIRDEKGEYDFSLLIGNEVQIFKGTGLGLVNKISAVDGTTIYFEKQWISLPDSESLLVAHEFPAYRNVIFTKNRIEDTGPAIMIWGHGHDCVMDGNSVARTGLIGTFCVLVRGMAGGGCHFFHIINNVIDQGRVRNIVQHPPGGRYSGGYITTFYSVYDDYVGGEGLHNVGYTVRNNLLKNDSTIRFGHYEGNSEEQKNVIDKDHTRVYGDGFVVDMTDGKNPFEHLGLVIEKNTVQDSQYGIMLGSNILAVVQDNNFNNVDNDIKISGDKVIVVRRQ